MRPQGRPEAVQVDSDRCHLELSELKIGSPYAATHGQAVGPVGSIIGLKNPMMGIQLGLRPEYDIEPVLVSQGLEFGQPMAEVVGIPGKRVGRGRNDYGHEKILMISGITLIIAAIESWMDIDSDSSEKSLEIMGQQSISFSLKIPIPTLGLEAKEGLLWDQYRRLTEQQARCKCSSEE